MVKNGKKLSKIKIVPDLGKTYNVGVFVLNNKMTNPE